MRSPSRVALGLVVALLALGLDVGASLRAGAPRLTSALAKRHHHHHKKHRARHRHKKHHHKAPATEM